MKDDLDEFSKEKSKLDNTLKAGKMSGDEYANALENLVNKYKDNVFGMDDLAGKLNKLGQKYKDIVDEINEAIGDIKLWDELEEQIKANDKVLEKELDKSLEKIQKYFEKSAEIMAGGIPNKKEKENGFFAYKDGLDKSLHGYAKDAQDYVKELEKIKNKILELKKYGTLDPAMSRMLDEVIEKLRVAKNEASSLTDAANFAELSEDIKELKKQLGSEIWEVWAEGIVGATGRITSALQSMNDAFGGDLFDEDFLERVSGRQCNKRIVELLILSGAFGNEDSGELLEEYLTQIRKESMIDTLKIGRDIIQINVSKNAMEQQLFGSVFSRKDAA